MKHITQVKSVLQEVQSYEHQSQRLALLKILVLGNYEIEQGLYRSTEEVFDDLDKE